jgi:copper binding protein CusF
MSLRFFGTLAIGPVPMILTACMSPGPGAADRGETAAVALGVDLGGSGSESPLRPSVPPGEGHERTTYLPAGIQIAREGRNDARATGTVNSVDPAQHKLNISHDPIPSIGWPAMTSC